MCAQIKIHDFLTKVNWLELFFTVENKLQQKKRRNINKNSI